MFIKELDQEFLNANTEDMQSKDPDIIVRAAHALPDDVVEMFKEEFETNDIWKRFRAVQEGRVYDLSYDKFGMSAKFNYPEALEELQPMPVTEKIHKKHSNVYERMCLQGGRLW